MLRRIITLTLTFGVGSALAAEKVFDFGEFKLDETPAGFRSTVTGAGKPGEWKVVMDDAPPSLLVPVSPKALNANKRAVLAQIARDPTDEHSPLLIYEGETFGDFKLATRFKLVDGAQEQMAGIAFRIQDEKNYYYIRASGLGGSFYFFKIVEGVRSQPIGVKVDVPKGVWHDLAIECKGNEIRASLDGKELILPLGDKTFLSGKVGFWTKSDSVSHFSETRIRYTPKEILAQVLVNDAIKKYPRLLGLKIFAADAKAGPRVIASNQPKDLGQPGDKVERDVITNNRVYYGKEQDTVLVTLPLHDSNGDTVAAVKFVMKSFAGQTEKNAIARALPILKSMETRVPTLNELSQ